MTFQLLSLLTLGALFLPGLATSQVQLAPALPPANNIFNLPAEPPDSFNVVVQHAGQSVELHLQKHSLRAPDFRVRVDRGGGDFADWPLPPVRTYRGQVVGDDASIVQATLSPDGLLAKVREGSGWVWRVTPPAAGALAHQIEEGEEPHPAGVCGNSDEAVSALSSGTIQAVPPDGGRAKPVFQTSEKVLSIGETNALPPDAACRLYRAEIAFDVDYGAFTGNYSTNVDTAIAGVEWSMGQLDLAYAWDVQICYTITAIVVRTSTNEPYQNITSNGDRLGRIADEWNGPNQPATIRRDLVQLITTSFDGNVIGLAWVGSVCSSIKYSWSVTDYTVMAHEIGHNWGGGHCQDPGCGVLCGYGCINIPPNTRDTMIAHRNSRSCLDLVGPYLTRVPPYIERDRASMGWEAAAARQPLALDVLANDADANCDPLLLVAFDTLTVRGGTVARLDNRLVYTPPANPYSGDDTFNYFVSDGLTVASAPVTITVTGMPREMRWWKFDEAGGTAANEESPANLVGAIPAGPEWATGVLGSALAFPASNAPVLLPALRLNSNPVTIACWVRRQGDQPDWGGLVFSRAGNTVAGLHVGTANELRYHWNGSSATFNWNSTLTLPDNQWAFAALVVEPTRATLYLDAGSGLVSRTNFVAHDPEEFDGATGIGADPANASRYFNGLIDDVRIYPYALSAAEIAATKDGLGPALHPSPADNSSVISPVNLPLSWAPSGPATSCRIYLGTNYSGVLTATTGSAEYAGSSVTPALTATGLLAGTTYYWRVDEVLNGAVAKGYVWKFTTGIGAGDYAAAVQSDAPVGWWRLDEPQPPVAVNLGSLGSIADGSYASDVMVNQLGAITGDVDRSIRTPDTGGAKVTVPYHAALNPSSSFSLEFWMKTELPSGSSRAPIYSRCGNNGYIVYIQGDGNLQFLQWVGTWQAAGTGPGTVAGMVGKWVHVACVFDASLGAYGTQFIYTNGILAGLNALPAPFLNNTCGSFLAAYPPVGQNYRGGLDEMAVYDAALSASQVQAHYDAGTNALGLYVPTVMADAPVAYWRFGETTSPASASNISTNRGGLGAAGNGTYQGIVRRGQSGALEGSLNTAARFGNGGDKVDINYHTALNPQKFSIECWARATGGAGSFRAPVTSRDDPPQRGYLFYAGDNNQWQFWTGGGGTGWKGLSGRPVVIGEWAHLVGTYDGSNQNFYVNGVLAGALYHTNYSLNTARPLRIGAGTTENNGNYWFPGDIDEVAVYSKVLTPARIAAHYAAARGANPPAVPPSISQQPASVTAALGSTVSLSVGAGGSAPLSFQWLKFGQPLAGRTNPTLILSNLTTADAGQYQVQVLNAYGLAVSSVAKINGDGSPPVTIARQPRWQVVYEGDSCNLSVSAQGGPLLGYQWRHDGAVIPGATTARIAISGARFEDQGGYDVVVTNETSAVTSALAMVAVVALPPNTTNYSSMVLADSPVSYWRLNESEGPTIYDTVGGRHGTTGGGVAFGAPGGVLSDNAALSFNGGRVEVPYAPELNPAGSFTVEFWMKTDLAAGEALAPVYSRCGDSGYTAYIQGDGNLQFLQWIGSWQAAGTGPNTVAGMVGKWTHVVCRFDRSVGTYGTQYIYTNGVLANAHALPGAFLNNGCGNFNLGDRSYLGGVDDVAFYQKALSPQSIAAHYQASSKLTPPLVPYLLGGEFILSWSHGTLQSAPAVAGPWISLPAATPPWTNGPPSGTRFFRLKL